MMELSMDSIPQFHLQIHHQGGWISDRWNLINSITKIHPQIHPQGGWNSWMELTHHVANRELLVRGTFATPSGIGHAHVH